MTDSISQSALDQIFSNARTHNFWLDKPVSDAMLHAIYEQCKWAPTSANSSPARFIYVKSDAAKQKLMPAISEGNLEKTMGAPVTVIVASDFTFYDQLPVLFPHADAKSWFVGNQALIDSTAHRNGTLQGAYFIMAARALGLDCGPMSGFDNAKLDEAFFAGTAIKSNFLINLGYGDAEKLFPRSPRLSFADACQIL
ncbi:MAG: malonic semialdehyde reductase [Arenimonas sp.]|nr:malonic semialdehyde reductase [Arenimonas sp.]MBP6310376.1 malonic semialdehyde reductase [Arenimonas sp.]